MALYDALRNAKEGKKKNTCHMVNRFMKHNNAMVCWWKKKSDRWGKQSSESNNMYTIYSTGDYGEVKGGATVEKPDSAAWIGCVRPG
mmetsp:Transcript_27348/g.63499  ORF Transcript_27348/g.63499 Transcript_27348/m.63499 type:complete len:87 (+) Transcript_27348:398-658(+)